MQKQTTDHNHRVFNVFKQSLYFESRLQSYFDSLPKDKRHIKKQSDGFSFHLNQGPQPNPKFSNKAYAHLFLKNQQLHLTLYKDSEDPTKLQREELYFENLKSWALRWGYLEGGEVIYKDTIDSNPQFLEIELSSNEKQTFTFCL